MGLHLRRAGQTPGEESPGPARVDAVTTAEQLDAALDEMARATDRLLTTVDALVEGAERAPSGLPDWTRGHVLTHLARNADAIARLAHWARTGEQREMYPGGPAGRNADIEQGAGRQLGDLRLDLADASERLLGAFAGFPPEGLAREVTGPGGSTFEGWELPLIRVREVEVHHVDLAAGYSPADWPAGFVRRTLDQVVPQLPDRAGSLVSWLRATEGGSWQVGDTGCEVTGPAAELLGWLLGRADGHGLSPEPDGPLPTPPRWM